MKVAKLLALPFAVAFAITPITYSSTTNTSYVTATDVGEVHPCAVHGGEAYDDGRSHICAAPGDKTCVYIVHANKVSSRQIKERHLLLDLNHPSKLRVLMRCCLWRLRKLASEAYLK